MSASTDFFEARTLAYATGLARQSPAAVVALDAAARRTLARDLEALAPMPGFASSAMDGWVVAGEGPWRVGTPIVIGDATPEPLEAGHARPIGTGGVVPPGAFGVVRFERGSVQGDVLEGEVAERSDIRELGEEARAGQVLLTAGAVLTPPRLALAATAGHDSVVVRERPRVEVLVLGNEVVASGIAAPGRVRDAFSPSLPSALEQLGGEVVSTRAVPDDLDATTAAIAASTADLVIVTGGSSRGSADHTRAAIRVVDGHFVFDGVGMRPGHPVMLATRSDGTPMLCLPGNPLAGLLAFASFAGPLVRGMLGQPPRALGTVVAGESLRGAGAGVRLVACTLTERGVVAVEHQGTGMTRGLALADCVVVVPPEGAEAGAVLATLPLPWVGE